MSMPIGSPLLRFHLGGAMAAAVCSCLAAWAILAHLAFRSELESRAMRQVQGAAEGLAAAFGSRIGSGQGVKAGPDEVAQIRIQLAQRARCSEGDVAFRVYLRDGEEADFRPVAGSGAEPRGNWETAERMVALARLGESSYLIGPRVPKSQGTRQEDARLVLAAGGYRSSRGSPVSAVALVQAPLEKPEGMGASLAIGGAMALGLSLLLALVPGILSWRASKRELAVVEEGLKKVNRGAGEYRIAVWRNDEVGRIKDGINELTSKWQRSREEARGLEAQLDEAGKRAGVAEQAKTDFLANMSHEVRTPMNGILGTLSLLDDTGLEESQRGLLQMARTSGERLLRVVNDILDYARLDSAEMKLERKRVCLEDLTLEVARLYAPAAFEKGVELLVFLDPRLPVYVEGDEVRLRQVLENLVENAVKFTSSGEVRVEVHAGLREYGRRFLQFGVRDTGMGISAVKQKELFGAFFQQDTSTTRVFGGSGLGLAICKKLSELHGGDLLVESREGSGSHFSFEIPLRPWRGTIPGEAEEKIPIGSRIGLLTQNEAERTLVECYLKEWGMTPVLISGGVTDAETAGLQAVIWDADGSGFANLEGLRKAGAAGLALLALHTKDAGMVQAGVRLAKRIEKPFGPTELRRALGEAINPAAEPGKETRKESLQRFAALYPARILVVEDQPMNQKIVQMMLQKLGYAVQIASNGREGVDAVCEAGADLVFMDLQMPVLGGIEATLEIRSNFKLRRQPVIIAMTGYALSGVRESCIDAGMNDFLSKPLSVDDLREVIERNSELLKAAA